MINNVLHIYDKSISLSIKFGGLNPSVIFSNPTCVKYLHAIILFSKNLIVYYCKCYNLIGYTKPRVTRQGRDFREKTNAYSSFFEIILKKKANTSLFLLKQLYYYYYITIMSPQKFRACNIIVK